jgi:histidine triad (HIT) family protein
MSEAPVNPQQLTPEQQAELQEKLKNMSPEELMEFQKQQCIFCQLISGKVPSKKLHDDAKCLAILDINPAAKGHILIIPKEHYAIMPQMPEEVVAHMFVVAKKMSQLLLKGLRVDGTSIYVANGLVAGQKAQHFMIHVIPRTEGDGLLDVEEHFVDKVENDKIMVSVGNRLNQLLGLKKEVVGVTKEESADDILDDEENDSDHDKDSEEKDDGEVDNVDSEAEPEDDEDSQEKNDEKEVPDDDEEDKAEESEEDDEDNDSDDQEENDDKEDDEDASLDDIANLFK